MILALRLKHSALSCERDQEELNCLNGYVFVC